MKPATLLQHINSTHSTTFELLERYSDGEQGAFAFDIATLLFYSYDNLVVRELLWRAVLQRGSLNLLRLYFAHLILRQVDWSLRYHDQATSERFISRGWALLQEIEYRANRVKIIYQHSSINVFNLEGATSKCPEE